MHDFAVSSNLNPLPSGENYLYKLSDDESDEDEDNSGIHEWNINHQVTKSTFIVFFIVFFKDT